MTFSAVGSVTAKILGQTLFLHQQQGFTSLVNNDIKDWASLEAIMDPTGVGAKGFQYALEPARNPSNAQVVNPSTRDRRMISGDADDIVTVEASSKVLEVVATFDDDVYLRAMMDPSEAHVQPLQLAMWNQTVNQKEHLLKQYYMDGSGVQATVSSVSVGSGVAVITLHNAYDKAGNVIFIQENQKLVAYSTAGAAHDMVPASDTIAYYLVTNVDHENNQITVAAKNSSGSALTISSNAAVVDGDVLYNYGDEAQGGPFDISNAATVDYGKMLYSPGLPSLGAADGRLVYGLTMSGKYAGSQVNLAGAALDSKAVTKLFSRLDRAVGESKYDYPFLKCSHNVFKYLIDSDEGKVMFQPGQRMSGGKGIFVDYGDYSTELVRRRFVPDTVIWAEPKLNAAMAAPGGLSKPVLQLKFSGFDFITDPQDNKIFRQKLVSGNRVEAWECHMKTFYGFCASQSAAIGSITNFSIS
jgi:hypothetical protein